MGGDDERALLPALPAARVALACAVEMEMEMEIGAKRAAFGWNARQKKILIPRGARAAVFYLSRGWLARQNENRRVTERWGHEGDTWRWAGGDWLVLAGEGWEMAGDLGGKAAGPRGESEDGSRFAGGRRGLSGSVATCAFDGCSA